MRRFFLKRLGREGDGEESASINPRQKWKTALLLQGKRQSSADRQRPPQTRGGADSQTCNFCFCNFIFFCSTPSLTNGSAASAPSTIGAAFAENQSRQKSLSRSLPLKKVATAPDEAKKKPSVAENRISTFFRPRRWARETTLSASSGETHVRRQKTFEFFIQR